MKKEIKNDENTSDYPLSGKEIIEGISRAAPIGIGIVRDRVFIFVNDFLCDMLGYSREEIIGNNSRMIYPTDDDYEYVGMEKYQQLKKSNTGTVETRFRTKSGKILYVILSSSYVEKDKPEKGAIFTALDITEREKTKEELKKSEEKYRSLVENLQEGIWVIDENNCTSFVNPKMAEMLGYTVEEMRGKSLFDFANQKGIEIAKKYLENRKLGIKEQHDFEFIKKNGNILYTSFVTSPIFDDKGNYKGALASLQDITARKNAERKIKESEEKYRELYNNMSTCVAIYEATDNGNDFIFKGLNKAGEKRSKVKYEEIVGKSVLEVFPSVKEIGLFDIFKRVYITGNPEYLPTVLYKDNRMSQWVENYVYKLPSGEIVAMYDDVSERKKAEETLRNSEEKYRLLLKYAGVGIGYHDLDGKIIMYNDVAARNLGGKPEDFIGKYLDDIFDKELADRYNQRIKSVVESGEELIFEDLVEMPTGQKYYVSYHSPIRNSDGNLIGVQIIAQDLTEQKKVEHTIKESEEKFRSIFENAQDAIFILDKNDRVIDVNNKASKLFSYTREELLNMVVPDFQAPEVRGIPGTVVKSEINKYKDHIFESLDIDKFGNIFPVEISQSLFNLKGEEVILNIVRDISPRKKMEEKIKDSEMHYRSLFENSPIAMWEEDYSLVKKEIDKLKKSGTKDIRRYLENNIDFVKKCVPLVKIIDFNDSVLKLYNAKSNEEYLNNLTNVFSDKSYLMFKDAMICIAEGKTYLFGEDKNYTIDGRELDVIVTWSVVPGHEKNYDRVYVSDLDNTFQKKAQDIIKESERLYRTLFESVQVGVVLQSINGKIIHSNKVASEIFSLTQEDILQKTSMDPIWNMILEDGTPVKGEDHPSMITVRTGEPLKDQIRGIYGNDPNKVRWLKINTLPIIDEKTNTFQEVLITFDDITDLKKYQDNIKQSEEKYSRIVNMANEGIWIVDSHYLTTFVNSKMADMLGYTIEEMIGKSAGLFLYENNIDSQVNRMAARAEGISQSYELTLKKKNGERIWTLVSATPIWDNKNNFKGSFAMFTDITERKQNEEIIKQFNDNLKLLNKILRHDISNDLTVVSISLEMIETKDEDIKNKAFNAIKRSVDLIEKIRTLESTMETRYDLKPMNIGQIVEFIKKSYANVEIDLISDCTVMADEALISVIDNILNNAIIHGKTDRIDIKVTSDDNICQVNIADYGKGIPDHIKGKIFNEEFSYGESKGTGLGLYISKKTIERYGGKIEVTDTKPHGATFILHLKLAK